MKSITYSMLGLFILSLVLVAGNSFSQHRGPLLTPSELEHFRKFGFPGAGATVEGYNQPSASGWDTVEASTMTRSQLRTPQGDYLAEISDLVIAPDSGRVSDVVITRIRGMGAKGVIVPFSTVSKTGGAIFLYSGPEDVYRFYGQAPYWSEGFYLYSRQQETMGSYRTSELIGATVQTSKGEDLGRIDDLVIDSANGHVVYLVVSGRTQEKMVGVPFSVLSKNGEKAFILKTTKEQLEAAPVFTRSDITDPKYAEKINRHYRVLQ